ncbi:trimethyllysine dioxygenase, mitochondrial isoform X2 [Dromaius novaehollandiae]|uniref:trimethyllysine dioxygenase, mitochondrial isoform X2 n=1 Tax=Dromaius novaehollandiae TaxID=8790 RepID=UPI00311E1742
MMRGALYDSLPVLYGGLGWAAHSSAAYGGERAAPPHAPAARRPAHGPGTIDESLTQGALYGGGQSAALSLWSGPASGRAAAPSGRGAARRGVPAPAAARMWCWRLTSLFNVPCRLSRSTGRRSAWLPGYRKIFAAAAARWHHTAPESLSCAWQLHGDHLELRYANTLMRFDFVWLRDHCRSASCYNTKTNQRSLDTASVDLGIKPKAVRVDETTLFVTWPDGHVTRYGLEWLVKNSYEGQKQQVMHPRILWNAEIYRQAQIPSVDCRSFLETDEGLKEFLRNFLLYGIAFVENVTPTKEDTQILAERISLIRETIYGRMWYFTSDFSRGDTAYTKLALDRHTDTTYFQEPCGYNNYDRAVINTVPYDVVHRWYTAHRTLTAELRRPENELWVKLKPGKALFIDNWRVLHGREAFTGYRQLCGCYLTRDDVLNTARLLGLQA